MPSLLHRCDGDHTGAEKATIAWIRPSDGAEFMMCTHHSETHAQQLEDAGFWAIPLIEGALL